MAVWLPKHENTLIVELAVANLYDKRPYGGSVGAQISTPLRGVDE